MPGLNCLADSAHVPVPDFSVIVQTILEPAFTVTRPPGVPDLDVTATESLSSCSWP